LLQGEDLRHGDYKTGDAGNQIIQIESALKVGRALSITFTPRRSSIGTSSWRRIFIFRASGG